MKFLKWIIFSISCFIFFEGFCFSSVSHLNNYDTFCSNALNSKMFHQFRRLNKLKTIVDTVTYEQGFLYLSHIEKNYPFLIKDFPSFFKNDEVGSPIRFTYSYGTFCPTTLRYIKTAGDIQSLFPVEQPLTIVEIGGGYGGLCRILHELLPIKKYIIIDLPYALQLTKKYLDYFHLKNVEFLSFENLSQDIFCDLLISNYAFSECTKKYQKLYFEKVLQHANSGYMICNFISNAFQVNSLTKEQTFHLFQQHQIPYQIYPEIPRTHPQNFLMTWGEKL